MARLKTVVGGSLNVSQPFLRELLVYRTIGTIYAKDSTIIFPRRIVLKAKGLNKGFTMLAFFQIVLGA